MLEVLYEDNHIIAVNKKISDIVQADKTGDVPLSDEVKAYIKQKYNKPGDVYLGIPHRIDRPVSGVVIFARTSKALTRLNKMFQEHEKEFTGFLSRIMQHEYDHLLGTVYTDRVAPIRKALIRSKLNNISKRKVKCDYRVKAARK